MPFLVLRTRTLDFLGAFESFLFFPALVGALETDGIRTLDFLGAFVSLLFFPGALVGALETDGTLLESWLTLGDWKENTKERWTACCLHLKQNLR